MFIQRMMQQGMGGVLLALLLGGCAVGPDFVPPESTAPPWQAALAHGGKIENLTRWWERLNDPLLNELIVAAEQDSPSLDMALAKINEARANETASSGTFYPALSAGASSTRSRMAFGQQVILQTNNKLGFDASWELDLFGKNRRAREAAQARFGASEATWHDARTSLAAEVAEAYVERRGCEAGMAHAAQLQQSRAVLAELTAIKADAGLTSPLDAATAQADAAESASAYSAKQGDCARVLNRLVALSGMSAPTLQAHLEARQGQLPEPSTGEVGEVVAHVLRQRPDVAIAEFNLAAASADIGVSKAALYPSLTLTGSVADNRIRQGNQSVLVPTWSFGPSLSIPLFSGGRAQAALDAAQARYDYALATYQQTVRQAVREVEDSLTRLNVANERAAYAAVSAQKNQQLLQAGEARHAAGLANRFMLENTRRVALQAQDTATASAKETLSAWIALYKALGGGWERGSSNRTSDQEAAHEQK